MIEEGRSELFTGELVTGEDWKTGAGMHFIAFNGQEIHLVYASATPDTPVDEIEAYIGRKMEGAPYDIETLVVVQRAPAFRLQDEIERLESVLNKLKAKAIGEITAKQMGSP